MMKALDLLPDGTFVIRDGVREWSTRRPTIGEWRTVYEAVEVIDAEAQAINAMPDSAEKRASRVAFRKKGQWFSALLGALVTLGDDAQEPIEVDSMPPWASGAGVIKSILEHWEEVPLDLSPVTPTNSQPVAVS